MPELDISLQKQLAAGALKAATRIQTGAVTWKTGIFPCEMALFMAACELHKVTTVVESGRGPDAYSTHVLDLYAEEHQAHIVSLDFFPLSEKWYQSTLSKSPRITCETGNSFHLFPRIMRKATTPTAVLIDGPKTFDAINLAAMTARRFSPALIALHNTQPSCEWYSEFVRFNPDAFHLEDITPLADEPEWQAFRKWEREQVGKSMEQGEHSVRDLDETSLIVALNPQRPSIRQLLACKGQFKRHPAFLLLEWSFV